jgi:hypothetical protein
MTIAIATVYDPMITQSVYTITINKNVLTGFVVGAWWITAMSTANIS